MASAFSDLAGIAGGMIMNIVYMIGVIVFAVAVFYITKFIQKNSKKQKAFTINAVIVDMNGVIDFDKLAFVKSDETGLLEMIFQNRKTDSIPPIPKHLIRGGYALLLNYAPGHYCVIDSATTLRKILLNEGGPEVFNLGMKKYLSSKQREIQNKYEEKKRKWELRAPWITLTIAIIGAVLLAAFFFYFGVKLDAANIASRTAECIAMGWK